MPVIEAPAGDETTGLGMECARIFGLVLAVKLLFLVLDPTPSFRFDDSGAYLATAIVHYIPLDRSFLYGMLLRPAVRVQSLMPLVVAQVLLSAFCTTLLGFALLRYFRARLSVAITFSLLCAVEPLQLSMERFVMTETVATFGFACLLCAGFEYLRSAKLGWLAVSVFAGVFLVSIRVSYLPIVLVSSFLFPALSYLRGKTWRDATARRTAALALLFSICFSQALLFGYRHWYASLADKWPAYLYRDGEFLLADFAPLVTPPDFPDRATGEAIFSRVKYPLSDPQMRSVQRWMDGGLVQSLRAVIADEDVANAAAKKAAQHAVLRNPLGAARLAIITYEEFFDSSLLHRTIRSEEYQTDAPSPGSRQLIARVFGIDASKIPPPSLTKRYVAATMYWSSILVTFPFVYVVLLALRHRQVQMEHVAMALFALMIVAGAVTAAEAAYPRFLTGLAWMTMLMFGSLASLWAGQRSDFLVQKAE